MNKEIDGLKEQIKILEDQYGDEKEKLREFYRKKISKLNSTIAELNSTMESKNIESKNKEIEELKRIIETKNIQMEDLKILIGRDRSRPI